MPRSASHFPPLDPASFPGVVHDGTKPGEHSFIREIAPVADRHGPRVDTGVGVTEKHWVITGAPGLQGDIGETCIEGVPFATDRWFCMYMPVYRQLGLPPHEAALAK